jgi:outer membrane lipoprotein-sorting protein
MNFSIRPASLFLATILLLALTACQTLEKTTPVLVQEDSLSAETVFRHLQKQQAEFSDLKSFIRTTVEGKNGRHSFRQSLLLREPGALRLDTYSMFQTLGVFIHAENETLLYNASKNQVIQGPQVWRLLADTLGTQVDFKNNISVFGGNIPHLQTLQLLSGELDLENKVYRLIAFDEMKNRKVEIEVDAETLLPSRIILTSPGRDRITAEWFDYQKVGNRDFAHFLVLEIPDRKEKVTLKYSDPVINEGIPAESFQLSLSNPS